MRDNIYRLGKGFPSAEEYEAWITATRINDRGIKIDTALAGAAHRQYEANKKRDLARVKEITGLDNPNSVQQFKGWLADQGFAMESIDKAHVAELLERDDLPSSWPPCRRQPSTSSPGARRTPMVGCVGQSSTAMQTPVA